MNVSANTPPDAHPDKAGTVQDTDQDSGHNVLELRTAARFLRTTPDALRKRIQRGTIQGYKEGGRWLVVVDTADRPSRPDTTDRPDTSGQGDLPDRWVERLLAVTEEATRYRVLCETSESTLRETQAQYLEQIAELQQERAALEARLAEATRPGWWRRLFGGGA
jgi:hypothetical protein